MTSEESARFPSITEGFSCGRGSSLYHRGKWLRDREGAARLRADLLDGDARRNLTKHEPGRTDGEVAEIGHDFVHDPLAGERQRAALQDLGRAVFADVLHRDDDAARSGDEVHRAAHALHLLA